VIEFKKDTFLRLFVAPFISFIVGLVSFSTAFFSACRRKLYAWFKMTGFVRVDGIFFAAKHLNIFGATILRISA
jgi:hypothetical protein